MREKRTSTIKRSKLESTVRTVAPSKTTIDSIFD